MKFFCPLTKICTATPEKMREHMEGELYKQFVAKDTGWKNPRTFWTVRMCFCRFFFVHLLKLDGKSLSMISKGSWGSIPKSEALVGLGGSYLVGNWWILSSDEDFNWWFRNLASKPIAEWRICMNLLKTNGWNTQPLAVCRCVFFPTGEFFQLLC